MKSIVRKNAYYDSVLLMSISEEATKLPGVTHAVAIMGTGLNKKVLKNIRLLTEELDEAGPNDLMIVIRAEKEKFAQNALSRIYKMLEEGRTKKLEEYYPKTLDSALEQMPDANLVVISVPGGYAKREALTALEKGLNVFLFSSNVSVEDEKELKKLAEEKGLLMMGPDCGTSIINGIALGFGNALRRGSIGIVAAAGSGLQQVSTLVCRGGEGISQAIGTGGRDLSKIIGGITMIRGIKYLEEDEKTKVIILISKPPSSLVEKKVLQATKKCKKPVVLNFLGLDSTSFKREKGNLIPAATLEEAANKAIVLVKGIESGNSIFKISRKTMLCTAEHEWKKMKKDQRYIRGIFSGGTLCYESQLILRELAGDVYSNMPLEPKLQLESAYKSKGHSCIDIGSEEFVLGRPHPIIDLSLRKQRILQEAKDSVTAVILLDLILGYGANPDPASELAPTIEQAKKIARNEERYLSVVASIIGTDWDPQNLGKQERRLRSAGVVISPSNAQSTKLAALIATRGKIEEKLFTGGKRLGK